MTVLEAVYKYGLNESEKSYKDQYGNRHNTDIPLDKLAKMQVKSVTIYPNTNEAEIVIIR